MQRQNLSAENEAEARARFDGAKLILFLGDQLAVIRRDNRPDLPFPGFLDLPGGMRDAGETPEETVIRETREELGLVIAPSDLRRPMFYAQPKRGWYFEAHLPADRAKDVVFGDEGQGWLLMDPWDYAISDEAVPHFCDRVRVRLNVASR